MVTNQELLDRLLVKVYEQAAKTSVDVLAAGLGMSNGALYKRYKRAQKRLAEPRDKQGNRLWRVGGQ